MSQDFFPAKSEASPKIYAFSIKDPQYKGQLKIGYTARSVKQRVAEQHPSQIKDKPIYEIVLEESAMRTDGSHFTDKDLHNYLKQKGIPNHGGEWFQCDVDEVKAAIIAVRDYHMNEENRSEEFEMRPEQKKAVEETIRYYESWKKGDTSEPPRFLWNAKMRFGKTFATYQLAKKMGWKKILILTFKPAVEDAWEKDLRRHIDFEGWQFVKVKEDISENKKIVCFGSFQNYLGTDFKGETKERNEWVHEVDWDCVIFDEYHFGAWREKAKELFEAEGEEEKEFIEEQPDNFAKKANKSISANFYLYLSGTPFRAIKTGEFVEEQIYNWTYSDEQKVKNSWENDNNPYISLPQMVMLTYRLPDEIREIADGGEFNEFDLSTFFSAEGKGDSATFKYKDQVQKWLSLIRGGSLYANIDELKMGSAKPRFPFADTQLLELLPHTFWYLPSVASCYAMRNLLESRQNVFYHDYKIIVAAGTEAGIGAKALKPVREAMENPLATKTITLSCAKLTTGVTVPQWSGIFMLRNLKSPEAYFQAAFRAQSPWSVKPDANSPNKEEVLKEKCYIIDFAPNRALKQIADYSCQLHPDQPNSVKSVEEFIKFLPVIAYDNASAGPIDAEGILDMATSGTTGALLAQRWKSALLVNVDNLTLERLLKNENAMEALMNIEKFRNVHRDIETIINQSDAIKDLKKKKKEQRLSSTEKKELSDAEKEEKKKRKEIQDKLVSFATRIPVFMYLTDFREMSLKDVITQIEPELFKKVTGLTVKDFELLASLGVFNSSLMNASVYQFKRYEDASLEYTGLNMHSEETRIGLYDTTISGDE